MKNRVNISPKFSRWILILGIAVGYLSISLTYTALEPNETSALLECNDDNPEQDKDNHQISVHSADALPSGSTFSLNHNFSLIETLPNLEEDSEKVIGSEVSEMLADKVLKILFSRIISPNAP